MVEGKSSCQPYQLDPTGKIEALTDSQLVVMACMVDTALRDYTRLINVMRGISHLDP